MVPHRHGQYSHYRKKSASDRNAHTHMRLCNVSDHTCPLPPLSVWGPVICSSPACTRTNRPQISGSECASWPRALASPGNLQKCDFLTHSRLWSQKFYRGSPGVCVFASLYSSLGATVLEDDSPKRPQRVTD